VQSADIKAGIKENVQKRRQIFKCLNNAATVSPSPGGDGQAYVDQHHLALSSLLVNTMRTPPCTDVRQACSQLPRDAADPRLLAFANWKILTSVAIIYKQLRRVVKT
jgi:hypothetical protein